MCGLAKGPLGALLSSQGTGNGGLDGNYLEINNGTNQLQTSQGAGKPGLIVEPPKHRTSIVRITVAIPAQLRAVDKLLEPKSMGLLVTAYIGAKFAEDPRYGRSCGTLELAKTLAVYDRSDPGAARAIIVAGSDFEGGDRSCFGQKPWCTYYQGQS